eukprot:CAMPEP_0206624296 /NCGR_PEP_ID=MMETSP0325_2-20121206/64029_1 /ASSEMBLY_ACC=CAM_ASM_000347 /TAXON_ID=2866 /ORGANISM="Crypthecodinium cohnii, Strain Seligo" /LENGTH=70 /DNA_ID=CAMNT_0054148209 /DNA_START=344 /DNA_END=553 /DNA_ORIENTATION=+
MSREHHSKPSAVHWWALAEGPVRAQVPKRAAPAAADEVPQTSPKFCQRPSLAPLGLELRGTETLSRSRAS